MSAAPILGVQGLEVSGPDIFTLWGTSITGTLGSSSFFGSIKPMLTAQGDQIIFLWEALDHSLHLEIICF